MPALRPMLVTVGLAGVALPVALLTGLGSTGTGPPSSAGAGGQPRPTGALTPPTTTGSPSPLPAPTATAPALAAPPATTPTPAQVPPAARTPPVLRIAATAPGSGTFTTVPGGSARSGPGPERRYRVEVEQGLGEDARAFAAEVDRTLADPRSWGAAGRLSLRRVGNGPVDIRVVLASPRTTDRLCMPLDTAGIFSCGAGNTAVINRMRWLRGADAYAGRLADYRRYVVNHEVGHTLGHGHEPCPAAGRAAPVMMQQTKGVGACRASAWPYP